MRGAAAGRSFLLLLLQEHQYEQACRVAATDQGLDPISAQLVEEGIPHTIEQMGGFVMAIHIALREQAWIGITATDESESSGTWFIAFGSEDENLDHQLFDLGGADLAPDDAIEAINDLLAVEGSPTRQLPGPLRTDVSDVSHRFHVSVTSGDATGLGI